HLERQEPAHQHDARRQRRARSGDLADADAALLQDRVRAAGPAHLAADAGAGTAHAGGTLVRTDAVAMTGSGARSRDYVALAKPRLNLLVVASTLVGYAMGSGEPLGIVRVLGLLLGTGLVAGGASAFNQVMERDLDALMRRTRMRP